MGRTTGPKSRMPGAKTSIDNHGAATLERDGPAAHIVPSPDVVPLNWPRVRAYGGMDTVLSVSFRALWGFPGELHKGN